MNKCGEARDENLLLNNASLADTLNSVRTAFSDSIPISQKKREEIALWLARRQGISGSYQGFIAPTHADYQGAAILYTGEKLNSRAAIGHILGEEAARCLIELNVQHKEVQQAINRNREIVENFVFRDEKRDYYCCAKCSLAFWNYLYRSDIPDAKERVETGVAELKKSREANGRWRSYPFYYTLFTLLDFDLPSAISELQFAQPSCERLVRRTINNSDCMTKRRRDIVQRVVEMKH